MKIIAGPCQHENLALSSEIAKHCKEVCESLNVDFVFKASFDKANRTGLKSKRGLGLEKSLEDFHKIKKSFNIPIITDIHESYQARLVSEVVDIIQIPAFLSRQTDLILSAVSTGKIVNIKKGQFMAPWDIKGILSKCVGAKEVWITERGVSFGYNNLVVDFSGLDYLLKNFDIPIIFDVTHSVQKPGADEMSSGGNREFVPSLSRAASALGIQNFFFEVHPDPTKAFSDGPNSIYLKDFEKIIQDVVKYNYKT